MVVARQHRLQMGPTTMYAQLASILRGKILSGEWPEGREIPTLMELCEQYDVARVTARQATQTLVSEGLLSSQRGRRTHVCHVAGGPNDADPLFTSIGSVMSQRPSYSIDVVSKTRVDSLPRPAFLGTEAGPYMRICKVDRESRVPYAYSENYVAENIARGFSDAALKKTKLARLVRDTAGSLGAARDRIFVGVADFEQAQHLDCPMSSAVAHVERVFLNTEGHIIYFGRFVYRGDKFAVDHDILPMLSSSPER